MCHKLNRMILAAAMLLAAGTAQAVTIDVVPVGNAGNTGELSGFGIYNARICGAVAYDYQIGKFDVTAGQYTEFLNAVAKTDTYGLYNMSMANPTGSYGCNIQRTGSPNNYYYTVATEWANRPVNYVSFWDAARFANWMQNDQPTGLQNASTTEDGAYTLNGYTGGDGQTIARNPGATWFIPSEDEWYKAAYYKGGGTNQGYWKYPTQSDTAPISEAPPGNAEPPGSANTGYVDPVHHTTEVGAYTQSPSAYGTFDQGGNVWQWNDSLIEVSSSMRGLRGGAFNSYSSTMIASNRFDNGLPSIEFYNFGFRVASVPEPGSLAMVVGIALVGLLNWWRRV